MKQTLTTLVTALSLATTLSCGKEEEKKVPDCLSFHDVATLVPTKDTYNATWSRSGNYSCYKTQPCPGDTGEYAALRDYGSQITSTLEVPQGSSIDRIVVVGNMYGPDLKMSVGLDDYPFFEIKEVSEQDDCTLNKILYNVYKRSDYHSVTGDGKINLTLSGVNCGESRQQPYCDYDRMCIALSKIIFQQCTAYEGQESTIRDGGVQ